MACISNFKTALIYGLVLAGVFIFRPAIAAFDANFMNCIQKNESNGSPSQVNPWGYTGIFQMGVNYAAEAGLCSNANKIPLMDKNQDWTKCEFDGPVARANGITSYKDFTTGPNAAKAQKELMAAASQNTWDRIVREGYAAKYLNQNVNGVVMTQDTMVAMAHLKGYGGLVKTLKGEYVADGNKTTTIGYAACLANCIASGGTGGGGNEKCSFTYAGACADLHQDTNSNSETTNPANGNGGGSVY